MSAIGEQDVTQLSFPSFPLPSLPSAPSLLPSPPESLCRPDFTSLLLLQHAYLGSMQEFCEALELSRWWISKPFCNHSEFLWLKCIHFLINALFLIDYCYAIMASLSSTDIKNVYIIMFMLCMIPINTIFLHLFFTFHK